jgi:hypothetical protein
MGGIEPAGPGTVKVTNPRFVGHETGAVIHPATPSARTTRAAADEGENDAHV